MNDVATIAKYDRAEWVKRFAYRAMLCKNGLDTESAMLLAGVQYKLWSDQDPEHAAELYSGALSHSDRRRLLQPRRGFGKLPMVADRPLAHRGLVARARRIGAQTTR